MEIHLQMSVVFFFPESPFEDRLCSGKHQRAKMNNKNLFQFLSLFNIQSQLLWIVLTIQRFIQPHQNLTVLILLQLIECWKNSWLKKWLKYRTAFSRKLQAHCVQNKHRLHVLRWHVSQHGESWLRLCFSCSSFLQGVQIFFPFIQSSSDDIRDVYVVGTSPYGHF